MSKTAALLLLFHTVGWSQIPSPPVAPVRPVTDDYHGVKVVDPYRYMENLKDPEVQAWIKAQNDYARAVLGRIPGRAKRGVRCLTNGNHGQWAGE